MILIFLWKYRCLMVWIDFLHFQERKIRFSKTDSTNRSSSPFLSQNWIWNNFLKLIQESFLISSFQKMILCFLIKECYSHFLDPQTFWQFHSTLSILNCFKTSKTRNDLFLPLILHLLNHLEQENFYDFFFERKFQRLNYINQKSKWQTFQRWNWFHIFNFL